MRHGRKSGTVRFDGHKLGLAVDTGGQLITAVDIMAGSAKDDEDALRLTSESAAVTGCEVEQVLADTAYGSAENRLQFEAQGVDLVAKAPKRAENGFFSKDRFEIDLEAMSCRCPAGQVTHNLIHKNQPERSFRFPAQTCAGCPLRSQCYSPHSRRGREVWLHREEQVLAKARARQRSPGFATLWRQRQVVEHRLARLVQLGMRQARYRGRQKTLFQALLTAAVANFTLVAASTGGTSQTPASRMRSWPMRERLSVLLEAFMRLTAVALSNQISAFARSPALALKAAFRPGS